MRKGYSQLTGPKRKDTKKINTMTSRSFYLLISSWKVSLAKCEQKPERKIFVTKDQSFKAQSMYGRMESV